MTGDEARARETREWLAKADDDIGSASVLIAADRTAAALFHCQQAAEKSLKAFLVWHDRIFSKTHDLKELGAGCREFDATLEGITKEAQVLTDYAWKLRYPGAKYYPTRDEAERMFALAQRVFNEIRSRLPI